MKIGLLTLPLHTNYGGILQAYALKTVLESMGHEVFLIDTRFNKAPFLKSLKLWVKEKLLRDKQLLKSRFSSNVRNQAYITYTKPFITTHFTNITQSFHSPDLLAKHIGEYNFDAFIVGSDQIWNPKYFKHIEIAFFSFLTTEKPIRISYAPSFGSDSWIYQTEKENICKELIKKFDAVSVREDSGQVLCEKYLGRNAKLVLDPTMLLSEKDYLDLLPKSTPQKNGKIFTYILDETEDKKKIINFIAKAKNLFPFELETIEGYGAIPLELGTKSTVENWISSFHQAEFIVTDSFHGTVFSILFNKPFFSVINFKRGATRFQSLLNLLDLEDRLLGSFSDLEDKDLSKEIDWEKVNRSLEELRLFSKSYLERGLKI